MKENVWIEVTLMFSPQLWNWVIGYQKQLAVGCHRLLFYKEEKIRPLWSLLAVKNINISFDHPHLGSFRNYVEKILVSFLSHLPTPMFTFFNLPWCWKKLDTLWPLTHLFFVNVLFEWPPFLYRPGCDKMEKTHNFRKKNNISCSLLKSTYLK